MRQLQERIPGAGGAAQQPFGELVASALGQPAIGAEVALREHPDAIMESRVVRLHPNFLTTSTAILSAAPISFDPIFSGLAWSLIFGLFASTVFTLFVILVTYWLLYSGKPNHASAHSKP